MYRHLNPRFAILALVAAVSLGCNRSPVVPVSGTVTFAGREVPEVCRLSFVPQGEGGRSSGATMDAEGNYRPVPFKGVEGLMPGTYDVRLSYFDLKKNGNPDREGDWKEFTFDAEQLVIEEGSGAVTHDIEVP